MLDLVLLLKLAIFYLATLLMVAIFLRQAGERAVRVTLYLYTSFLMLLSLVSHIQSISLGTMSVPYLGGSDGEGYYAQARLIMHGDVFENFALIGSNYFGYQAFLAIVFKLLGDELIVGLAINNLVVVMTLLVLYRSVLLMTGLVSVAYFSLLSFVLTTQFIFYANVLLKEPLLTFAVALLLYAVAATNARQGSRFLIYSSIAAAIVIFGTMRLPMLVLVPLVLAMLGRDAIRRSWHVWVLGGTAFALGGAVFLQFTSYEMSTAFFLETTLKSRILDRALEEGGGARGIVGQIMGGYTAMPLLVRLLTVPIPMAIQFVLPFDFWSLAFVKDHLIFFFSRNLNPLWYLFVGVFGLYAMFRWRHMEPALLRNLFLLGVGFYALTAFTFGGAIPRYASPYLVLVFPAIGYWINQYRVNARERRRIGSFFRLFYMGFGLLGFAYFLRQII